VEGDNMDKNEHMKLNGQQWDRWAKTFDNKWNAPFRYLQKKVISLTNLQNNMNFLDLGCGTGWAVRYASTVLKGQGNFIGIDMSEGMITKAKENAAEYKNVSFYKASSEELPLENNYFDVIICTMSFHHYLNPGKALSEAHRVLKPKGRIYILDGTTDDFITRWIDSLARKIEKIHVKQYSTAEYRQMFLEANLKYIKNQIVLFYPLKVHIGEK
jgi:ubiquinone/menaquinone biosynthesis C-methylase UbiE